MLITPSATPYDSMTPADIAAMPIDGDYGAWEGPLRPSVEWRFHLDILRARPEIGAVVHTHSTFATVLAIARKPIPACHYMIAAFGGADVRCSGYAKYGTAELSAEALRRARGRLGCLLANHGMIAIGARPRHGDVARRRARDDRQAVLPLAADRRPGDPVATREIAAALRDFAGYGLQARQRPGRRGLTRAEDARP